MSAASKMRRSSSAPVSLMATSSVPSFEYAKRVGSGTVSGKKIYFYISNHLRNYVPKWRSSLSDCKTRGPNATRPIDNKMRGFRRGEMSHEIDQRNLQAAPS